MHTPSDILSAIPPAMIATALVELDTQRPSFDWARDSDGRPIINGGNLTKINTTSNGKILDESVITNAFNEVMKVTETVTRTNYRQTFVSLAAEIGSDNANKLSKGLRQAVAAEAVEDWVIEALKTEGLNVNDPAVAVDFNALVPGSFGIDQDLVDTVLSTGSETLPTFRGLRMGDVQTALQMHHRGEI